MNNRNRETIIISAQIAVMLVVVFLMLHVLVGCGQQSSATPPAPNVQLTKSEANLAAVAVKGELGGRVQHVGGPDGSMLPYVQTPCYVLVRDSWDTLRVNDWVIRYSQTGNVVHVTTYTDGKGNWKTAGTGNRKSDEGWLMRQDYGGTVIESFEYREGAR